MIVYYKSRRHNPWNRCLKRSNARYALIVPVLLASWMVVFTHEVPCRPITNKRHGPQTGHAPHALCLQCDILDIRLPPKAADSGPSNCQLRGTCPIPPNPANSTQLMANLTANTERCANGKCSVWIAYIGDSLLRSPFTHLIDMLFGREWPVGADRNRWNISTYHVDQRVCCHGKPFDSLPKKEAQGLNCTFSRAFDTAIFVRNFFREYTATNKYIGDVCITWQWNRLADESLREIISNYTGVSERATVLPDDALLAPQMIVINPGLHAIMSQVEKVDYIKGIELLLSQMRVTAAAQAQMTLSPTRFVFHDITAVIDADLREGKRKLVNETMVVEFNAALQHTLKSAVALKGSE